MSTADTQDIAVEHVGNQGDPSMCDICGHALRFHDRIAERYCQATLNNTLSRACICSIPDSPHSSTGS